jgi:outer membrane receptor protein involved in Fe transport
VWLAVIGGGPRPAFAQRVSGQVQGTVHNGSASGAGGARVTATSLETTAATTVVSGGDGGYVLAGLPPGQYLITVTLAGGEEAAENIEVGTGQSLQFDIDVAASTVRGAETIVVSGAALENKTSEVATSVSREQLQSLPQNSRNFLNFAQLAPGMRGTNDEFKQAVSSGGLEPRQTNVFIDGVSLKNNIIEGGVVGQDSSRGNPFPQLAVSGFRVLTQNFKAEYEQAGTSIISSVTRSGGNDVHAEVFGAVQSKSLVAIDPFVEKAMQPKPEYSRVQAGGLVSGPIVKNKVFALAAYEGNYQNRANTVTIGNPTPENMTRFGKYEGSFTSPFREHLGFAKIRWVPDSAQTVDLSLSLRRETDIRTFGGQTSLEAAENVRNNVFTTSLRHQFRTCDDVVNEATAQLLLSQWNPGTENSGVPGQEFEGVVRIGGRDTDQDIKQRTITLRDDVSLPSYQAGGAHQFKVGGKIALQRYDVTKSLFGNPIFRYRDDAGNGLDFDAPFEAQYGVGNPRVASTNTQLGLYAQDDWQVDDRLTVNVGVRWDTETNPLNNNYETPADVRAAVTELATTVAAMNGPDFFPAQHYLTDGTQRSIFLGEIQPRLGASYDLLGDQHTVIFAGAGRYYDRTLFNTGLDERYRLQYGVRTFRFSKDGRPRDGQPTVAWDPAYLSRAGLQGLVASGVAPNPEIFLLENDTKPLHTDQYSFGVRQLLGSVNLSLTFSHIRGENGIGFYPANRSTSGNRDFLPVPGNFGNVMVSVDDIQTRFTGVYVTAEKAYRRDSRWGASATYTLGWSKIRGDLFNFDFPTITATPLTPSDSDERHHLVVAGIVGLPMNIKASTLISLGSGLPYTIVDASAGFGANLRFRRNAGRAADALEYSQVDLRLAKDVALADGHHVTLTTEVFNLLNAYNYGGYDGFIPPSAEPANPKYGQASRLIGPTRSFQLGVAYGF